MQPTEAQIKQYGKMAPSERHRKLREVEAELSSLQCSIRIARQHAQSGDYRERRIEAMRDEIERERKAHARRIAMLEKQLAEITQMQVSLPQIIEQSRKKIAVLSEERALLKNGRKIAEIYRLMQELQG